MVIGRKWWIGAANEECTFAIVTGVSGPGGAPSRRHSMVIVAMDAPGVEMVRQLRAFGYVGGGHAELALDDTVVPASARR